MDVDEQARKAELEALRAELQAQEQAYRELQQRFDETQAVAHIGLWEWDIASDTVRWSDELWRVYGLAPTGAPPTHSQYSERVHPDDRPAMAAQVSRAVKTGEPIAITVRLMRDDGSFRVVHVRGQADKGKDGAVTRLFGTSQDITELKRAEAEAERSNAILRAQQEASIDGILLIDGEGRIVSVNQRFAEIWNLPPALIVGGDDREMLAYVFEQIADPEAFMARVQAIYEQPAASSRDEVQLKDGRVLDRYTTPALAPDGTSFGRLWYFRDITERKRLEDALRVQNERLRELDALKVNYVNAVSHELRAPLTTIMGYTEFLEESLEDEGAPQHELIQQIQHGTRRLQRLVDDLLDSAMIEAGTFKLRRRPCDLGDKVHEVVDSLRPLWAREGPAIDVTLPEGPLAIEMDPQRIGQVLANLLTNAIKFTPASAGIHVRVMRKAESLRCEIADAGPGIAAADVPTLFQRFRQLECGKTKGGSGLGLSISKALVEAHGGAIGVESTPGAGSTFWFELPLKAPG